ncbi:MAG: DUF433 domain-containing protein [Acidithiobacillus sp.]
MGIRNAVWKVLEDHDMCLERITIDPQQCGGRPCLRNLRIRVPKT